MYFSDSREVPSACHISIRKKVFLSNVVCGLTNLSFSDVTDNIIDSVYCILMRLINKKLTNNQRLTGKFSGFFFLHYSHISLLLNPFSVVLSVRVQT